MEQSKEITIDIWGTIGQMFNEMAQLASHGLDWLSSHISGNIASALVLGAAVIIIQVLWELKSDKYV